VIGLQWTRQRGISLGSRRPAHASRSSLLSFVLTVWRMQVGNAASSGDGKGCLGGREREH
jgi:hypothetical protein